MVHEKGKKVLCIEFLKTIYGMLQSDLLSYKNMRKYLESDSFKVNPYDPCVTNKIIEGEPLTVFFFVDNVKSSHKVKEWYTNFKYGLTSCMDIQVL